MLYYNIFLVLIIQLINLIYNKIFNIKKTIREYFLKGTIYLIILTLVYAIKNYINTAEIREILIGNPNF
jgi:hypothetical protein